jgi:hypothetical protein
MGLLIHMTNSFVADGFSGRKIMTSTSASITAMLKEYQRLCARASGSTVRRFQKTAAWNARKQELVSTGH